MLLHIAINVRNELKAAHFQTLILKAAILPTSEISATQSSFTQFDLVTDKVLFFIRTHYYRHDA